jgi:hypothetical protein
VSEWKSLHSLTLAATAQPSRSSPAEAGQLRGIGPIANEQRIFGSNSHCDGGNLPRQAPQAALCAV